MYWLSVIMLHLINNTCRLDSYRSFKFGLPSPRRRRNTDSFPKEWLVIKHTTLAEHEMPASLSLKQLSVNYFREHHFFFYHYVIGNSKEIVNKMFKKCKHRALLALRRSQKHYKIFSNNVLWRNITQKQLRLETIEIAWFKVGSLLGL